MEGKAPTGLQARLGILTDVFTPDLIDAVIAKQERQERRRRLLPARLVVYFVLALCLFAREPYEEVIQLLTNGLPASRALSRVNRSSLCRARSRLGEEVLEAIFREVAGPLATESSPGAWWRGLRLLALDGTKFDVPDSPSNGNTFDGPSTGGGTPFGFPQVRAVVLSEIGTHGLLDAALGGYRDGERALSLPLARRSTGPGDLVIADRGFWSVEFVYAFSSAGADLLFRLQANRLGQHQEDLPDGSWLATMRPGKPKRLQAKRDGNPLPDQVLLRVFSVRIKDTDFHLATTLLDPETYPAAELAALYRQRWEIEIAFDEIKNHLGPSAPLRSRTPEGIRQELWAYFAVHHAVRRLAHTAAVHNPASVLDSDRISYLTCVRIIRRSIPAQLGITPEQLSQALADATHEARRRLLPQRKNRSYPRAIRKPSRWPVLRTRTGRDTVEPGRWIANQTKKKKADRGAGRALAKPTYPTGDA
ncbi:IS4 family transposase [Streptomyces sp. NPDC056224]|uniref:IS4 family transposase n=1 Tax=Streptomyces sp. NPDC056224 TaxID=3345750 RepID=UPI0035D61DA3